MRPDTSRSILPVRATLGPGLTILLGIALLAPPCPADTYPRQAGIDALHYAFRITLRDESDDIEGEATVNLRFLQDGLKDFRLDLTSPASSKGMTVSAVTSRGAPVSFEHKDDRLRIILDSTTTAGERRTFTVAYHGIPSAGLRIGKNRHGERTFFSDNWPDKRGGGCR